jgi:hypothetical protein
MSNPPKLRIVASAGELLGDYERSIKRQRDAHGPAASTVSAFWFLVRQGDSAKLASWVSRHPADVVAKLREILLEKVQRQ